MSKLVRFFAIAALVAGAFGMTPGPAAAQHHHGGGHWHGGGTGPGFGFGFGPAWGWGYPFYAQPYVEGPDCGWVRVRVWRHGHWALRRAWRCY
jgi:hypothetical protein